LGGSKSKIAQKAMKVRGIKGTILKTTGNHSERNSKKPDDVVKRGGEPERKSRGQEEAQGLKKRD